MDVDPVVYYRDCFRVDDPSGEEAMNRDLILQRIRAMRAALAMRVIPEGADKPLPELPPVVEIDPADDGEVKLWDRLMPKFRGMLNATVKNKQRYG